VEAWGPHDRLILTAVLYAYGRGGWWGVLLPARSVEGRLRYVISLGEIESVWSP
jgi:hypothetical protein